MYHILTMSRGDAPRLRDWLEYHASIGFTHFHMVLDNPIDDSEAILREVARSVDVCCEIIVKSPHGMYLDGLSAGESWERIKAWRAANDARIKESSLPIIDPLSDRQYIYFQEEIEKLAQVYPNDWLALIDVDEYISIPDTNDIKSLVASFPDIHRLRFLNFNFDMRGWDGSSPVRNRVHRWAREDIEALGSGWETRAKSMVKLSHALPISSVHSISHGPYQNISTEIARLHHYKFPNQRGIEIPYSESDYSIVYDSIGADFESAKRDGAIAFSESEDVNSAVDSFRFTLTLRSENCFAELAETIKEISHGEEVIFSPTRGDWGDGLNNYGTRQFLDYFEIPYQEINKQNLEKDIADGLYTGRHVVVGGSGGWSQSFNGARKATELIAQAARSVIVLPSTYNMPPLDGDHIRYFARDRFGSLEAIPEATFCHDLSFFISFRYVIPENRVWRMFSMGTSRGASGLSEQFSMNWDISRLGDGDYLFVDPLFNILNNFKVIVTDRIYLAIVAVLLGLEVRFLPAEIEKTADLFKSSIEPYYNRVKLETVESLLGWAR